MFMGRLAFPILISMALSPFLGAIAFQAGGANLVFGILALLGVGNVFLVALALDSIYQVMVHSGIYALELLLTATILALVPYVIVRGLVTRLARRRSAASRADGRPGDRATPGTAPEFPLVPLQLNEDRGRTLRASDKRNTRG